MIQQALDTAVLIKPDLWSVKNIFDKDELVDLLDKLKHENSWSWQPLELQETLPRLSLEWPADGGLNHIWSNLDQLDFSRFGLKLKNVLIWKDNAHYIIGDHVDNDRVVAAMQIYLNDGPDNLGTWFQESYIPFVQNTGYIMKNQNKLVHGMKNAVPEGFVRYSLYALFDTL